jgi:hypothetical protein
MEVKVKVTREYLIRTEGIYCAEDCPHRGDHNAYCNLFLKRRSKIVIPCSHCNSVLHTYFGRVDECINTTGEKL